jgi:hypothetical protein
MIHLAPRDHKARTLRANPALRRLPGRDFHSEVWTSFQERANGHAVWRREQLLRFHLGLTKNAAIDAAHHR